MSMRNCLYYGGTIQGSQHLCLPPLGCTAGLCPMLGVSNIHRFGKHVPPVVSIIMGYVYLLVPPVLNPVVYCIKTREIRTRIWDSLILEKKKKPFPTELSKFDNMTFLNISTYGPFLLTGFPGLEDSYPVFSILFCFLYAIALMGNSLILVVIWVEPALHTPMYLFLSMLATSDLGLCATTLPSLLKLFWFNDREVHFDACLTQMFFIHLFSLMESGILFAMAFDRYVAISNPLRYTTILTNVNIAKIALGLSLRAVSVTCPGPLLIRRLRFCEANVLSHSYCLHPDIIKLSCSDHHLSSIYGLIIVIITFGMDSAFILLSYVKILITC
ncbi:olfactory receptor 51I2-like [Nannospalax galili]|uniref:olfactory receptor 51I2-like n=1 Tax=Nannospalax galili TaxID=1026970 RepID=UPI0004ED3BFB|nr:olfactory receptor 51I2-like [Nannospalax galili]